MYIRNIIVGALLCMAVESRAIFYHIVKYQHPVSGQQVWTFSDVHVDNAHDIYLLSSLQRRAVVNAAKNNKAYVIVEDPSFVNRPANKWLDNFGNALRVAYIAVVARIHYVRNYTLLQNLGLTSATAAGCYSFELVEWYRRFLAWNRSYGVTIKEVKDSLDEAGQITLSDNSPLLEMHYACTQNSVPCYNAEFRFANGWMIHFHERKNTNLSSYIQYRFNTIVRTHDARFCYPYTFADIWNTNQSIVDEIQKYPQQDPVLAAFYKKCIVAYEEQPIRQWLKWGYEDCPGMSIPEIVATFPELAQSKTVYGSTSDEILSNWRVYHAALLDARIVNALIKQQKRNVIFICAGGAHIDNIAPVLKHLGYAEVAFWGNSDYSGIAKESGAVISVQTFKDHIVDLEEVFQGCQKA